MYMDQGMFYLPAGIWHGIFQSTPGYEMVQMKGSEDLLDE